jgi:multiple sugar transport system substrate-binding protein
VNHAFSRRTFFAGTVAASAGLIVGCSSGNGGKSGGSITVADPSYSQPAYKTAMDAVTAQFTEATGATAQQVAPPSAQYTSAVVTQLQAGSPPDVIRIDDPNLTSWVANGWLLPVDSVLSDLNLKVADLIPANGDAVIDGKLYGIVKEANPRVYIYNKKIFDQAGVETPTDLDSLTAAIRKTTDSANGIFGIGFNTKQGDPTTLFIQIMPFIYGFGGKFFDGNTPTATDPKVIEALEFIQMIWKDNLCPRGIDAVTINNLVANGKVASTINGAFVIIQGRAINAQEAANLTTAKNPLPGGVTMRASAVWGVTAKGKSPDLAKQYLKALLDPKVQQTFQSSTGVMVARREGVTDDFIKKNPWFDSVVDAGWSDKTMSYFPQSVGPKGSEALQVVGEGILDMLYNDTNPDAAMETVQSKLESTL